MERLIFYNWFVFYFYQVWWCKVLWVVVFFGALSTMNNMPCSFHMCYKELFTKLQITINKKMFIWCEGALSLFIKKQKIKSIKSYFFHFITTFFFQTRHFYLQKNNIPDSYNGNEQIYITVHNIICRYHLYAFTHWRRVTKPSTVYFASSPEQKGFKTQA